MQNNCMKKLNSAKYTVQYFLESTLMVFTFQHLILQFLMTGFFYQTLF